MRKRVWIVLCLGALLAVSACGGGKTEGQDGDLRYDRYVALGDSYTAAPGTGSVTGSLSCSQSVENYPHLVAAKLGSTRFLDNSCSGATTRALTKGQFDGVTPQLDGLDDRTQLVTLGMGGNDAGIFSTLIYRCTVLALKDPEGSPCATAIGPVDGTTMTRSLDIARTAVSRALRKIAKRAPHARIVLVGYPQIIPASGTCSKLPIAAGDYPWAHSVVKALDDGLRTVAKKAGVTYIDMLGPSAGHDICSSDPWIAGNRSVAGKAVAFHPFEAEQQKVADLILKTLEGKTVAASATTSAASS